MLAEFVGRVLRWLLVGWLQAREEQSHEAIEVKKDAAVSADPGDYPELRV
jgi:hypothetical protein